MANDKSNSNSVKITIIICATVVVLTIIGVACWAIFSNDKKSKDQRRSREKVELFDDEKDTIPTPAVEKEKPAEAAKPAPTKVKRVASKESLRDVGFTDDYSDIVCYIKLEPADLAYLTKSQLRILRNTIYARHGRKFRSKDLQNYFNSFDWYVPLYDEISPNALSATERYNIELISRYE